MVSDKDRQGSGSGSTNTRITQQRRVVLDELRAVTTHPTADEIYDAVRKRLPRISLGTVYRNLEALSQAGAILRLPGTPMRFDATVGKHYHIRCIHCSRVGDVPATSEVAIEEGDVRELTGWDIVGRQVELLGVCPVCKSQDGGAGPAAVRSPSRSLLR